MFGTSSAHLGMMNSQQAATTYSQASAGSYPFSARLGITTSSFEYWGNQRPIFVSREPISKISRGVFASTLMLIFGSMSASS